MKKRCYEEALHHIQGFGVGGCRPNIRILFGVKDCPGIDVRIKMLVYRSYSVLPYLVLPFRSGQVVGKDALVPVESHHLAGLLLKGHLPEKIFNSGVNGSGRVFIHVHAAVLV